MILRSQSVIDDAALLAEGCPKPSPVTMRRRQNDDHQMAYRAHDRVHGPNWGSHTEGVGRCLGKLRQSADRLEPFRHDLRSTGSRARSLGMSRPTRERSARFSRCLMKLHVTWVRDLISGRDYPVIANDRGERLPCVTGVDVSYRFNRPTEIVIALRVDGKNVTLGEPERK